LSHPPEPTALVVACPLAGRAVALDTVPDAVFAQRMMGDGVAIQPLADTITAPFDGEITTLHPSAHAVAVRSRGGAEVLIHVGLDTVALAGNGFSALVSVGDTVACGEPLIRFDLDAVALAATSLVTPVIITSAEFRIGRRVAEGRIAAGEELMTLVRAEEAPGERAAGGALVTRTVTLSLPHGIHARPAARLSACLRPFEAEVQLVHGDKRADAHSPIGMLSLGTTFGDTVSVEGRGKDAEAAVVALIDLLSTSMGEESHAEVAAQPIRTEAVEPGNLRGIIASPGLALGTAYRLRELAVDVAREGGDPASERAALAAARAVVGGRIEARSAARGGTVADIMNAHLALLDDADVTSRVEAWIAEGTSAAFAWRAAMGEQVEKLVQTGNARLVERTADLVDVERQVLAELLGQSSEQPIPADAILIADDLLPSQLVTLAEHGLRGICLAGGGPTSHVAILCAGMALPALVAMGEALAAIDDGTVLLLDADAGELKPAPTAEETGAFAARITERQQRRAAARSAASQECRTTDGTRINYCGNVGSLDDAIAAAAEGAEGSGLVRSEFLFLGRKEPPSEDEQHAAYQAIAEALPGRPVLIRLLDIGGDKPAAYLPLAPEENPALGVRGIRLGLAHPALLESQVRAILRVRPVGQCRILIPMIASVEELRSVRMLTDRVRHELGVTETIEVGVMVETPAAAMTVDLLARGADFFSVGTNDLTQYVLAMDRGNPSVAAGVDALHPAVLRMIAETCRLAATAKRWVGVCGGLASDPVALPILIGLGVTELSSVPGFVAEGKAIVRGTSIEDARELAAQALRCSSANEVRALATSFERSVR